MTINGSNISITGSELDFKDVTDYIHGTGAIIRSAYFKEPSLEDAYLRITGRGLSA